MRSGDKRDVSSERKLMVNLSEVRAWGVLVQ